MAGEARPVRAAGESWKEGPSRLGPGARDAGTVVWGRGGSGGRRRGPGSNGSGPEGWPVHPCCRRGASRLQGWVTPRLVPSPPPLPGCHRPLTPRAGPRRVGVLRPRGGQVRGGAGPVWMCCGLGAGAAPTVDRSFIHSSTHPSTVFPSFSPRLTDLTTDACGLSPQVGPGFPAPSGDSLCFLILKARLMIKPVLR